MLEMKMPVAKITPPQLALDPCPMDSQEVLPRVNTLSVIVVPIFLPSRISTLCPRFMAPVPQISSDSSTWTPDPRFGMSGTH